MLQMRQIEKRFGGVRALRGVDLEVNAGEVVALLGENGAGKSTLMKCLGGIHQPDGGQILLDGQAVMLRSVKDAARYGIAFIHQELNVLDNLDVAANIFLGREPTKGGLLRLADTAKMQADARKLLDRVGLAVAPETLLAKLSVAQQQMVEIAKALSQEARLLIMDEPTSSLTLAETARLLDLVKELRAQGVSVIYISHRLGEVEAIADCAVVLRDGANAGILGRAEINHDRMVALMVGRALEAAYRPPTNAIRPQYFAVQGLRTARYPAQRISFDVGQGEILGFAGLVGAGRSEMARAVFGVDATPEMELSLAGEALAVRAPRDAIRRGVYLVPEDRRQAGLITDFSIRENFSLPALENYAAQGLVSLAQERQAAVENCAKLNVKTPSVEVPAINLSGGNQQKVVLAKWLALSPRVLLFDEPTRGVDVGAKAEIYALMRSLAASGVAIVMISSDMEEVLHLSDRVAVMHEGRITGFLGRRDCTEENIMRLAVGGKLSTDGRG